MCNAVPADTRRGREITAGRNVRFTDRQAAKSNMHHEVTLLELTAQQPNTRQKSETAIFHTTSIILFPPGCFLLIVQ